MKTNVLLILIASLFGGDTVRSEIGKPTTSPDRIAFYAVPLVCPAAPEIGCGSRSKPILIQLEREASVAEAWLNRAGTVMAIVWKPETKRKQHAAVLETVSKKEELDAHEVRSSARTKLLKEFASRRNWHRSSDLDRLSEEEARIIAARLVRRIETKVSVPAEKVQRLRIEFADLFKRRFTSPPGSGPGDVEEQLLSLLRRHLNEKDVAMLRETLPRTLRPLPGEQ